MTDDQDDMSLPLIDLRGKISATPQLTKEQAVAFYESDAAKGMSDLEIATFQLEQDRLCVPFDIFHRCVQSALGRPVWTHEFADTARLRDELEGKAPKPNLEDIFAKLPTGKDVLCVVAKERE